MARDGIAVTTDDGSTGRRDRPPTSTPRGPVSTPVVVVAVLVPVLLLAGVLLLAHDVVEDSRAERASAPLAVVPVESPDATSPECMALLRDLPPSLGQAHRVGFSGPAPVGTAAYRLPGGEPVVVRCGLPAPPGFRVDSILDQVDTVQWFRDRDPADTGTSSTWVAVDRARYVVMTLPDGSGTGPIQDLSAAVTRSMSAVALRPAPLR